MIPSGGTYFSFLHSDQELLHLPAPILIVQNLWKQDARDLCNYPVPGFRSSRSGKP
jgi:hypothetical protein